MVGKPFFSSWLCWQSVVSCPQEKEVVVVIAAAVPFVAYCRYEITSQTKECESCKILERYSSRDTSGRGLRSKTGCS
jgi:hypothetical protein